MNTTPVQPKLQNQTRSHSLSVVKDSKLKSNVSISNNRASAPSLSTDYVVKDVEFSKNGASFVSGSKKLYTRWYDGTIKVGRLDAFVAKFSPTGRKLWEKVFVSVNSGSSAINDVALFKNRVIGVGIQNGSYRNYTPSDKFLSVDLLSADGSAPTNPLDFRLGSKEGLSLKVSGNLGSLTIKTFAGFDVNGYPKTGAQPETWNFFYNLNDNTLLSQVKVV